MLIPDEILTNMGIMNFKKKVNSVEVCHMYSKEFWGRLSLLQNVLKEI